jgi:ribosomal protein L11
MKSVKLEDVSDFINAKLKEFTGKEVNVEISIKITEK